MGSVPRREGVAWAALAALLALGSLALAAVGASPAGLDWQPARALHDPWRWWTAALVHWSPQHLLANTAGAVVLAALGLTARLPGRATLAWLLAWPLTQLGLLLLRPDLARYGGLSGVLHAGVAIAALHLLRHERGPRRAVGAALGLGLAAKVLLEAPWGPAVQHAPGWDIALAPAAHASGALAGALAAALVGALAAAAVIITGSVSAPTQADTHPETHPLDTAHPP